jgi:nucleoside-diphosphate-sugar epimerase
MQDIVLVTGASGFIGNHLVRKLVQRGEAVRAVARRPVELPGSETVRCDLADAIPPGLLDGVSRVIHLAGVTKALGPGEYARGNETVSRNLANACGESVEFIHVSSLAAAGPSPEGSRLGEDAPPRPVSLYGRSKLAGERALLDSPAGARAVILRPAVVYGPGDLDVFQVFRAVSRGFMAGIGSLDARFSYIHVDDLVRAILAATESSGARGRTFFIANREPVTWREFVRLSAEVMGRGVRTFALPPAVAYGAGWISDRVAHMRGKPAIFSVDKVREGVHRNWVCDVSRAESAMGFTAPTPLAGGIETTLDWYRQSGWLTW